MVQVFVSYSSRSRENMAIVDRVSEELRKAGLLPYIAERETQPERNLSEKIRKELRASAAIVVIVTPGSEGSYWMQQEIGYAFEKIPLVGIRVHEGIPRALIEAFDCVPYEDQVRMSDLGQMIQEQISKFKPRWITRADRGPVSSEGPYEVESGNYAEVPLSAGRGDVIVGRIDEAEDQEFDWYIVHEHSLATFKSGETATTVAIHGDESAAGTIRWRPRENGRWSLLLKLHGNHAKGHLSVRLRREGLTPAEAPPAPEPYAGSPYSHTKVLLDQPRRLADFTFNSGDRLYITARASRQFSMNLHRIDGESATLIKAGHATVDIGDTIVIPKSGKYALEFVPESDEAVWVSVKVNAIASHNGRSWP